MTGRSFDHRKQWLEDRILSLAQIFAVAVHAYAIMSNHFHLVVETDPTAPSKWSNHEVATRWAALSAGRHGADGGADVRIAALAADAKRLSVLRDRLGSLSWFMRYLKEPIARGANGEDGCTGRFWEGRFQSQTLLDDSAVLACMVYVDLNPVRAGAAAAAKKSAHTSYGLRIRSTGPLAGPLSAIASSISPQFLDMTAKQYVDLVEWTSQSLHPCGQADTAGDVPDVLERLSMRPRQWLMQVPATETQYCRVVGRAESLLEQARTSGMRWVRGIGLARRLDRLSGIQ